jgi:anti-sigma factor RsiW
VSTRRKMRCIELVESVTEWMEGALDDEHRLLLEAHLATCTSCVAYVAQLRVALALLPRQRQAGPPAEVRAALLDAVRAVLLLRRET